MRIFKVKEYCPICDKLLNEKHICPKCKKYISYNECIIVEVDENKELADFNGLGELS